MTTMTSRLVVIAALIGPPAVALGDADSDWVARSSGPGVTSAVRFDQESDVTDWVHQNSQADHVSWQTTGQVSGGGALRFDILKDDKADSGDWVTWLSEVEDPSYPNGHKEWYAGETLHVQYRIYVPRFRAEHRFLGGGGWKTSIISRHNQAMVVGGGEGNAGSNQSNEIVLQNTQHRSHIQGYNQDGSNYPPWESGRSTACSGSDKVFQNMIDRGEDPLGPGYSDCEQDRARYGGLYSYYTAGGGTGVKGPPDPLSGGFIYYPDEWLTIYLRLDIGEYGIDRSTTVNLWAARATDDHYSHLIQKQITLGGNGITNAFDAIWLLPYNTGQDPDPSRQNTYVLYDELIVSTKPIAVPGAADHHDGVAPSEPADLAVL